MTTVGSVERQWLILHLRGGESAGTAAGDVWLGAGAASLDFGEAY